MISRVRKACPSQSLDMIGIEPASSGGVGGTNSAVHRRSARPDTGFPMSAVMGFVEPNRTDAAGRATIPPDMRDDTVSIIIVSPASTPHRRRGAAIGNVRMRSGGEPETLR